jgi:hypothetical protein
MTTPPDAQYLPAEQRARVAIDRQLTAAGWAVQDQRDLNLFGGQGVAVREVVMATGLQCALSVRESRRQMSAMASGTSDSMRNLSQ